MNRRRFMSTAALGLLVVGGGCLSNRNENSEVGDNESERDDWSPTIEADDLEIAPGDDTTLTIGATEAAGVTLTPPDTEAVRIDANEHEWSPPSDNIVDTYPQHWYWESQQTVEGEFPVTAENDTEPGEYEYEITVFAEDDPDGDSETDEFVITVIGE